MAYRCVLVLLLLALAVVVESSTSADSILGVSRAGGITIGSRGGVIKSQTCNGLIGDCIDEDEEMGMESESTRRVLKGKKYISYGALNKNNPPCKQRGSSYYGCGKAKKVNPYKRGCSAISHCERYLN